MIVITLQMEQTKHCGCQHLSEPALSVKMATGPGWIGSVQLRHFHSACSGCWITTSCSSVET